MNWMLFYREHDMAYFFFNGDWPIAVRPSMFGFGWESESDSIELQNRRTESAIPIMTDVLANSRKKMFVVDKLRFHVDRRGVFQDS